MSGNVTTWPAMNFSEDSLVIDEEDEDEFRQQMEKVVAITVPIFFSIVVLVGFFGNLLVVLVVSFNKQMRNTTNLLILNLAVADILFIVFCVPFTATSYALPHNWPFGDVWCKIVQFLIVVTALVSIYTLVLMSLDRFLAVVYPIESMTWRTEANCRVAITTIWIICVVVCTPLIASHGVVPPSSQHSYCIFLDNQTIPFVPQSWDFRWNQAVFSLSFFNAGYVLPLLLICGLYSVMLHRLWNKAPGGRASAESIKNKKRVIKMVMIVVIIFALCWLPIQIILVLRSLKKYPNTTATVTVQIISHILAYSNSCVNPILYAFLSEPFRRGFCAVITCIRPSGPHGLQHNGYELEEGPTNHQNKNLATVATTARAPVNSSANCNNKASMTIMNKSPQTTTTTISSEKVDQANNGNTTKNYSERAQLIPPTTGSEEHSVEIERNGDEKMNGDHGN